MITGRQIRDARFRAGLGLRVFATWAGVNPLQLACAEAMYGPPLWSAEEFDRLRSTVEAADVDLIPENSGGAGVHLRSNGPP